MKPAILFRAITPDDLPLFRDKIQCNKDRKFTGIVAYTNDVEMMGMVGLDGWTKTAVSAHWYIKHPRCIDPLWREVVGYLRKHGYIKIVGTVSSDITSVLRMLVPRLGWRQVGRIKDGHDIGIDTLIFEYAISDTVKINQRQRHAASVRAWR